MKTNELIKELEAMDFEVEEYAGYLDVYCDDYLIVKVGTENIFSVDTKYTGFDKLNETKKQQLFKLLTEYASTPNEERKEEKKYMYYIRNVDGVDLSNNKYLSYYYREDRWLPYDGKLFPNDYQYAFTHSWLKSQGVDIEQLQEVYEEIEVTE